MNRYPNPYKKTKEVPSWFLNWLKVLLILVFIGQFIYHIPEGYVQTAFQPKPPTIETIEYNQLQPEYSQLGLEYHQFQLGTLFPIVGDHLYWGGQLLPFQLPDAKELDKNYFEISNWKMNQLGDTNKDITYKGQQLELKKINAIFLKEGLSPIICEERADSASCFSTVLSEIGDDYEVWLSLETEQRQFFSKIKVGNSGTAAETATKEVRSFWKQLIKKEKFKDIDKLAVEKPIFHFNNYLFQWGDWQRHMNKHKGESRIKMDIATFKRLLKNSYPKLYTKGEFVPFYFQVGFWDRKRWDLTCRLYIDSEEGSILDDFYCLEAILKDAKVGDHVSVFLYHDQDFLDKIAPDNLTGVPSFILNGRRINLSLPLELIDAPIDPTHAPLNLKTSQFTFQLSDIAGEEAMVRMDTTHAKNQTLLQHYQSSGTTKIVHIPKFKTIRRLIGKHDNFLKATDIDHTYTLVDKVYAVHTFPEFYDFDVFPPLIQSRGLSAVLDRTTYPIKDYAHYRDPFQIMIGSEKVKLLQTNITIIPKEGPITRYITDNPDRFDINNRLDDLPPESSVYFDQILFERSNGEQLAFPLAVAIHLK